MKFKNWLVLIGVVALLLWISAHTASWYAEKQINKKLMMANGKASSIQVNLLTRSLQIESLEWSSMPDSANVIPHVLRLKTVSISGISLYQLLINKIIRVNEIQLDSGVIRYNMSIKNAQQKLESPYTSFECRSISVNNIETQIITDTVLNFSADLSFHLASFRVQPDSLDSIHYSVKAYTGAASNISLSRHEGMYGGTIKQFSFDTQAQNIVLDSILLIPNFSKYKFAQFLGEQAGRVNLSIPKLIMEGVAFEQFSDSTFIASKITIPSFDLFSFKDKRLPFLRDYTIPLPMEGFRNLSWKVKIDSILINSSRITIEEFPANGDELTHIEFTDVTATLVGLNNRTIEHDPAYAHLYVTGLLMGSGKIQAKFQLPIDGKSVYTAEGEVLSFPLIQLNPVFVPVANIRIESGHLNKLVFDFSYSEFTSKGKLDIDYEDLHLLSLKKNSSETHELRTILLNILIQKDRDQSGKNAKAIGVIDIERDRRRLIFNVWWKSVLDGLRSSMVGRTKTKQDTRK